MPVPLNLTGDTYGGLTVIRPAAPRYRPGCKYPAHYWLCRCKCGAELEVAVSNLRGKKSSKRPRTCKACGHKSKKIKMKELGKVRVSELTPDDVAGIKARKISKQSLMVKYGACQKIVDRWLCNAGINRTNGKAKSIYFDLSRIATALALHEKGLHIADAARQVGVGVTRFESIVYGWRSGYRKAPSPADLPSKQAAYEAYASGMALAEIAAELDLSRERIAQMVAWYAGYLARKEHENAKKIA